MGGEGGFEGLKSLAIGLVSRRANRRKFTVFCYFSDFVFVRFESHVRMKLLRFYGG